MDSVRSSNSRISASSSNGTRTRRSSPRARDRNGYQHDLPSPDRSPRLRSAPRRIVHELQPRARWLRTTLAQYTSQSGPARVGRKNGSKTCSRRAARTPPRRRGYAAPNGAASADQSNHDAVPITTTVSQGISDHVPQHLMQVRAVEAQRRTVRAGAVHDDRNHVPRCRTLQERGNKRLWLDGFPMYTIAPPEFEYVTDDGARAFAYCRLRCAAGDPAFPSRRSSAIPCVADRRERIADFMSDIRRQAPERRELHSTVRCP